MLARLRSTNRLKTESQKAYGATISLLVITAHIFTSSSSIIHFASFVATLLLFFLVFILTF